MGVGGPLLKVACHRITVTEAEAAPGLGAKADPSHLSLEITVTPINTLITVL